MSDIPAHFELPDNLSSKKFLAKLSKQFSIQSISQQYSIKSYFDSFDWRLYRADILCELNQSQQTSQLRLIDHNSGRIIASEEIHEVPSFYAQFSPGEIRTRLTPILEMRALLPLSQLPHELTRINVLNNDEKIILRIEIEEYEAISNHINLYPLKGYDKAVKKISDFLQHDLAIKPATHSVLNMALKMQRRKAKDYSSKLNIKLKPSMPADEASILIYQYLLQAIKINEAGTIADTDSEFLHDFRVAVRRTRAGLSQIKDVLAVDQLAPHREYFAWLGQITSLTRDLDVYLLSYPDFKAALPISIREDLAPLYHFLKQKQTAAQKELAKNLNSSRYRKGLESWEKFLKQPHKDSAQSNSALSIKQLANRRIWKVYQRLLKEASAINDASPAEALHDLRKTCKKLRYLIEFFQSLYPVEDIKFILKDLKGFQTVLGNFQDYEVQEVNLKNFSEEMMENNVQPKTFLAMGVLIQHLDAMKCKARGDFSGQFAQFKKPENHAIFYKLLA